MIKYLFFLCLFNIVAVAQDLPRAQVAPDKSDSTSVTIGPVDGGRVTTDSLPFIYMTTIPSRVVLSVASLFLPILPGTGLFLGWHSYTIQGKIKFTPKAVKPYFIATRDQDLLNLYQRHRQNRTIWYAGTAGGVVVGAIGVAQLFLSLFQRDELSGATTKLILGGGLLASGQIARFVSFGQLRRGINLYNDQYASPPKRRVSLHVGLSSQPSAGAAVYLRF